MEYCESKVGGACAQLATWQQVVHAGDREAGRILFRSYWCDAHAASITEKRRRDWSPPPKLIRLPAETSQQS
jgi:hypothetical protein